MNLCAYGAASQTVHQEFLDAGYALGLAMARRGHTLVFGAGATGLMGAMARGITAGNGTSIGVAPHFFQEPGALYENCTQMIYTDTMRQRKEKMESLSQGIIMTPGGIGTMDEFFEILTLKQLGRHTLPIALLNTRGYFGPLLTMLENAVKEGFLEERHLHIFQVFEEPEELLDYMESTVK